MSPTVRVQRLDFLLLQLGTCVVRRYTFVIRSVSIKGRTLADVLRCAALSHPQRVEYEVYLVCGRTPDKLELVRRQSRKQAIAFYILCSEADPHSACILRRLSLSS